MVLYVYTSIYTFTKKKKNILIYILYYIIKDTEHLLLIYLSNVLYWKYFIIGWTNLALNEKEKEINVLCWSYIASSYQLNLPLPVNSYVLSYTKIFSNDITMQLYLKRVEVYILVCA